MKQFKYTQTFSTRLVKIVYPEEKSVSLALASLEALKDIIPQNLKVRDNPDLVFNSFNAAVVNRVNLNDDGIQTSTALRIYQNFVHKFCDLEHDRTQIVGSIINAGFSEFLTNRVISEQEASNLTSPFNICLASVVWPVLNSDFAEKLIESSDETSMLFESISASWEIGFDDIVLAIGSRDLAEAEIVTDANQIAELKKYLRAYGGEGKTNQNEPIYRVIVGEPLPLGIGYTTTPAAAVKGVVVAQENVEEQSSEEKQKQEQEIIEIERKETPSIGNLVEERRQDEENKKNTSQKQPTTVKNISIMKINKIDDINDANFSELSAATIKDFVSSHVLNEIDKISSTYAEKLEVKQNELKAREEEVNRVQSELEKTLKEFADLKNELHAEQEARAKEKLEADFNTRMSFLDTEFELGDKEREVIAKRIRGLNEDNFGAWLEEFNLFAEAKKKKNKANKDLEDKEDSKASLESALEDAEEERQKTLINTPSIQKTQKQEFAEAFKLEDFQLNR